MSTLSIGAIGYRSDAKQREISSLYEKHAGTQLSQYPASLRPLDEVASTIAKMGDTRRVDDAKARLQRIADHDLLPAVKRLSTIEFAQQELRSLETHLR